MNTFIKINGISMLYAIMIFIPIEILVNVPRISRITGWSYDLVWMISIIGALVCFILLTLIVGYLSKRWLKNRKSSYLDGPALAPLSYPVYFHFCESISCDPPPQMSAVLPLD